jgi:hypothetical protein
MERFPKLEMEKRCNLERMARQQARNSYFERLKNDTKAAADILEKGGADALAGGS